MQSAKGDQYLEDLVHTDSTPDYEKKTTIF